MTNARAVALWVVTALVASLAGIAPSTAADVERLEVVGFVPLRADEPTSVPPRDRALHRALFGAVRQVADSMLTFPEPPESTRLEEALGNDPYAYALRFRIIEDRGVVPAPLSADPDVESVYAVLVDVHIDRDRIRDRLQTAGVLEPPRGSPAGARVRLSLEGIDDYRVYQRVRDALTPELGVRSAVPSEAEIDRIVLEVDSSRSADEWLDPLQRALEPEWQLVPISVDRALLRVRVRPGLSPEASPGVPPADSPRRLTD